MLVCVTAVDRGNWGVIGCAIIGAAAGFYYFKVILAIYTTERAADEPLLLAFGGI